MPRSFKAPHLLALVVVASIALDGCGGASDTPFTPEKLNDVKLREVGDLYRVHQINKKAPPKTLNDLAPFATVTLTAYEAIRTGEVVVRYGATLPDTDEEPKTTGAAVVLAYLKDVPTQGGPVLLLDRSTRHMTADEFKTAKLAGVD
jgi:hypothetical protein